MNRAPLKTTLLGVPLLVFAAALAARLLFLGRAALWEDEIIFIRYMADVSLSTWQAFLGYWGHCLDFGQLPLAGVLLNAYMHLAGRWIPDVAHHVLALRIPGALAGAFFVVGVYWLGRRLVRRDVAWAATAMAAFFFFPVYYAREVYCYPWVLLCAAFAFLFFHKSLFGDQSAWTTFLGLWLWATALGLTHFGCSVALASMAGVAGGWGAWNAGQRRPLPARRAFRTMAACVLAALAVAPYWLRILLGDSPHLAAESPYSLPRIVNDMVAKFFLGDRLVPALLAWLLFGAGLVALWRRRTDTTPARATVLLVVLTTVVLAILAKKSQYASSRYFAMLAPLVYFVYAQGLWTAAEPLARLFRRAGATRAIFWTLAILILAIHAGLFLPALYRVREKACPYAAMAQWLNENGFAGAPYFFDGGGFDLRVIPGYHPTPRLTPTVFIAGNGPGFLPDLQNIQRELMRRFPVSYFIRNPTNAWDEATRFYRNGVEFRNPPMETLRRYGIVADADTRNVAADARDILYNVPADALAMAREARQPIYVEYPGFRCARVVEETYGRVLAGRAAELVVHNLRETPLAGTFRISGAIAATNSESPVRLRLPGDRQMDVVLANEQMWTLTTPAVTLPAGESTLRLEVANPAATKLLLMEIQFVE